MPRRTDEEVRKIKIGLLRRLANDDSSSSIYRVRKIKEWGIPEDRSLISDLIDEMVADEHIPIDYFDERSMMILVEDEDELYEAISTLQDYDWR